MPKQRQRAGTGMIRNALSAVVVACPAPTCRLSPPVRARGYAPGSGNKVSVFNGLLKSGHGDKGWNKAKAARKR